jgi:D-xylulose kinase
MPSDQLFIGIDSGTQGTKAIVFSRQKGQIVAQANAPHGIIENERGGREQKPHWWIDACLLALEKALGESAVDRQLVKAISVSGQQHGMVALDVDGEVIRPAKLWCDTETEPQCRTLTQRVGGEKAVRIAIGNAVAAGFTASKLLWLKENEPQHYDRLATILLPHDYINFWLTGQRRTEFGDASGTAYFDVENRRWSKTLLDAIDDSGHLETCLPEFVDAQEPCGYLRPEISRRLGLPAKTIVASGGGDNMMAAIGTGNIKPGIITASLGTSGTIYAYSDKPIVDSKGELAAFCSSSGGWLPLVCTMNVTVTTEILRAFFKLDLKEYTSLVSKSPPGAEGLILLPYFNGERTPALPGAKATLHGMTPMNLSVENLCRAGMEGATLGLRYGLEVLERNGISPKELRLIGGGANNPIWRQMVADIFEKPVVSPENPEAGALGAALQAMWCYCNQTEGETKIEDLCGAFVHLDDTRRAEPANGTAAVYGDIYSQYLKLDRCLRPLNQA